MNQWQMISTVIAGILILIGIVLVVLIWKKKKEGVFEEPNYHAFFILGVIFLPVGIAFLIVYATLGLSYVISLPFIAMGIIYMLIGISKRDTWKK
jgi:uncharacterized membrane protein HdeD (DUF308 family)